MSKISVLGLGAMGSRMAAHLIKAGHDVIVWNRTADATKPLVAAGATQAQTPREAAAGAAFVVAMVRDDDASRRVWVDPDSGALAGMAKGAVAIESSTKSKIERRQKSRESRFLDSSTAATLCIADAKVRGRFGGKTMRILT